ncbi:MAG TPA: tRNA (adenosine(37)-N6)-threonylcarbamoyltransferase complex transferase subunit TsaD [Chloroflexota bacterium]|nr:tRNA (adenosine(37)-N6)-threonylcarbamoyltransferase complex transferase subunit TsaD [Chloroflexota bacterium]
MTRVLAIESSCDETAAAVVRDGRWIEGDAVASQIALHRPYGGVVPEVASRAHVQALLPVIHDAMEQAEVGWSDIDVIAATRGPGLAGSLLIGFNCAKALAFGRELPFVAVNHLEGHIYANWLAPSTAEATPPPAPEFPLLCLVVSGGHSDMVLMRSHGDLTRLGHTRDDAAGEAFDKVARILGLGFPGGPAIQAAAELGDPSRYPLARAWLKGSHDFSFSGVKTAVLRLTQSFGDGPIPVADIAAAFQESVADVLSAKTAQAAEEFGARQVAVAGGVAANSRLRAMVAERSAVPVLLPSLRYCTDNAAMIASAGYFRYRDGARADLDTDVSANLPIATSG